MRFPFNSSFNETMVCVTEQAVTTFHHMAKIAGVLVTLSEGTNYDQE